MSLENSLRHVKDFPVQGIDFVDITPILKDATLFNEAINKMINEIKNVDFSLIVATEARGFIFGAAIANAMGKGFIPVRKKGKLPHETVALEYDLEYGSNTIEIHKDAIKEGDKVVFIDDLLATGGTTKASAKLIEKLGGQIVSMLFFIELIYLNGRKFLNNYNVRSIIKLGE